MPIYEYQCAECGQLEEVVQKMSDPPLSTCPGCSGKMQKIMSRSSFQLKGGGWYADAYSSTPPKGTDAKGTDAKGTDVKGTDAKAKTGNPPKDSAPAPKKASDS